MRGDLSRAGPAPVALAAVLLLATASPAAAGEDDAEEAEPAPQAGAPPGTTEVERLRLSGRLFVRDTVSEVEAIDEWRHERAIESARARLAYRRGILRLSLEVEFAGRARLKNTYIRVDPTRSLEIRAGRFKRPMSFIGLASRWQLPAVERGVLAAIEVEGLTELPFSGGRADGVKVVFAPDLPGSPELTLATFQSDLAGGATAIDASRSFTQDLYLRLEGEPAGGLSLAASFALITHLARPLDRESVRHAPFGGLEVAFRTRWLRLWLEGFAGESFFFPATLEEPSGAFFAGRVLAAPRFRRPAPWLDRIEPYLLASAFDPSTDHARDRLLEVASGVSVLFPRRLRLQLEGARRFTEPLAAIADGTIIRLQLSTVFETTRREYR